MEVPKFSKICYVCADYSTGLLFVIILVTLAILMVFMIFQVILSVLLTPTSYCFHDQVKHPLPEVLLKYPSPGCYFS